MHMLQNQPIQKLETLASEIQQTSKKIGLQTKLFVINHIEQLQKLIKIQQTTLKSFEQKKRIKKTISENHQKYIDELAQKKQLKQIEIGEGAGDIQLRNEAKQLNIQYIRISRERIQAAKKINIQNLKSIQIKNKKQIVNEIFKWILVVIYKQPVSYYYWPNFQKQAFQRDNGKYFIDKLGKESALFVSYEEEFLTQSFLENFTQILKSAQMKGLKQQAQNIYVVIKCFKECYLIRKKLLKIDAEIGRLSQIFQGKQKQLRQMKNLLNGLKNRVLINNQYFQMVYQTQTFICDKVIQYKQKIRYAKQILSELEKKQNKLEVINQKNDVNQCHIF